MTKEELAEIQNLNHYVAGFTDATIEARYVSIYEV